MDFPTPQHPYRRPVNEAVQWIREHSVKSCTGIATPPAGFFVPLQPLRSYFDYYRIVPILKSILTDEEDAERLASLILKAKGQEGEGYLLVFLILLRFDRADQIESFLDDDALCDKHLPYQSDAQFPHGVNFTDFCDHQMPFCAPHFHANNRKTFSATTILPIVDTAELQDGDRAKLSVIRLHPEFDHLNESPESNHRYVRKSFSGSDGKRSFSREVDGYIRAKRKSRASKGLLQYYGTYTQRDEYHIILEYADLGTWEHFMQTHEPPRRKSDFVSLWASLLEVGQAVHLIHLANGVHQDIHSRNLLRKSKPTSNHFSCSIRLADLGRSSFSNRPEEGRKAQDMYGTKENGAPECYRAEHNQDDYLEFPQTADIWSLGCIYSEAAKWMTEGWAGVQRYRDARLNEVRELDMEKVAFFHDTAKTLECVDAVHGDVGIKKNPNDPLTSMICSALLKDMFHGDARLRLRSEDLVQRSQNILDSLQASPVDDSILNGPKRVKTEPSTSRRALLEEQRSWSTNADLSQKMGQYTGLVETPMRNMSLSEDQERITPPNAKGKQRVGRETLNRWSQEPIDESEAEEEQYMGIHRDAEHAFGPMVESPRPANRNVFSAPPPHYANARGSRNGTGASDAVSAGNVPNPSRSDSRASDAHGKERAEIPELSFNGASHFMHEKRRRGRGAYLPWGRELKGKLKMRDHVFIIDNSYSTNPYWESILGTFELLAFLVEEDDPDGVEVRFTNEAAPRTSKSSEELMEYARSVTARGNTDLEECLTPVLEAYGDKLFLHNAGRGSSELRPLSIYILTDGVWKRGGSPDAPMLILTHTLKECNLTRRQVGIQFITFGHNKEGLQYMKWLDDMSRGFGLDKDFVDTEPSTGNIWKMLLGAIDDYFDAIDEDEGPADV